MKNEQKMKNKDNTGEGFLQPTVLAVIGYYLQAHLAMTATKQANERDPRNVQSELKFRTPVAHVKRHHKIVVIVYFEFPVNITGNARAFMLCYV